MAEIPVSNLAFRGRIKQTDPQFGRALCGVDLDYASAATYIIDFTLLQQAMLFDMPRSMFVDNTVNPSPIDVFLEQTGQYFPVPPYSAGYFPIASMENARVKMISSGGVLNNDVCYVAFYNYDIPPIVWNGFAPLVDGARVMIIGADNVNNQGATNPVVVGGNNGGNYVSLAVDSLGRLLVVGSAAGNAVYGPDAVGNSPSQPPVLVSGIDAGGLIRTVKTDANGELQVDVISSALPTGAATEATLSTRASEATLSTRASEATLATRASETTLLKLTPASNGAVTSVSMTGSSVTVLASNSNRKGYSIWNDGAVIVYVRCEASAASSTTYSYQLNPGAYFESENYTGEIRAIGVSGDLRVTEYS